MYLVLSMIYREYIGLIVDCLGNIICKINSITFFAVFVSASRTVGHVKKTKAFCL